MEVDPTCPICERPLLASGAHIIVNYRTEESWQGVHAECRESGEDGDDPPPSSGSPG